MLCVINSYFDSNIRQREEEKIDKIMIEKQFIEEFLQLAFHVK